MYCLLPADKFLDRKVVALAGVFQADKTSAYGGDKVRFFTDNPTRILSPWEVCQRQRTSVRSLDVTYFRLRRLHHLAPFQDGRLCSRTSRATRFDNKFGGRLGSQIPPADGRGARLPVSVALRLNPVGIFYGYFRRKTAKSVAIIYSF
jgi:hypothetical protein